MTQRGLSVDRTEEGFATTEANAFASRGHQPSSLKFTKVVIEAVRGTPDQPAQLHRGRRAHSREQIEKLLPCR